MKKQIGQLLTAGLFMASMGMKLDEPFRERPMKANISSRKYPLTKLQKKRRLKEKMARKARKINWR